MKVRSPSYAFAALALVSACGGATVPAAGSPEDVQAKAMSQTYAGKNKCNAKAHDRPFVIEWDATDMSGFEARAKSDVVFVKYAGCELQILDGCTNDSVRGALGSYRPVEWTSGSVEVMQIDNEGELFAKLPLGANSLGGRVQGGEKFRMEYFVAGTRTATRDKVFRSDLAAVPACREATHFVYGYNLGAFALGASTHLKGEVGGSFSGIGVGGSRTKKAKAEKTGGDLGTCRAESAKEIESCKTPIRLTLREIDDGVNPDAQAMLAAETPSAQNLAGKLKAESDKEKAAAERADQARLKLAARDGKGCLAELDVHDALDPRPAGLSTNGKSGWSLLRSQCLMLAGQCDAGKRLYRSALQATSSMDLGPEQLDRSVDGVAGMFCQGAGMSARDRIMKASIELSQAAYQSKKDAAFCSGHIKTLRDLIPTTPPRDEDDATILNAPDALANAGTACLVKAGDCDAAWTHYEDTWRRTDYYKFASAERQKGLEQRKNLDAKVLRSAFESLYAKCK
jgi:hypothetical protein